MDKFLYESTLISGAEKMGLPVENDCIPKLTALYELMIDENTRQNLTRITKEDEAAEKHILDSLSIIPYLKKDVCIADIGCGAGFPALPVACIRNDVKITAVDSTQKRIRYVDFAAKTLGLHNVSALCARAEDLGKKAEYRECFDVCTARAVAALNILCEYCLPLVKVGGIFAAMKANADEEIKASENAIKLLGGKISQVEKIKLPFSNAERTVIIIKKVKPTPLSYPRIGGVLIKKPL